MSYTSRRYRPAELILFALFSTLVVIISCNSDSHDDNNEEKLVRKQSADQTGVKEHDGSFLIQTANFNMKMQALGTIGTQYGASADVKTLAQHIIDGHARMSAQLTQVASANNISLPVALNETDKLELNSLTKEDAEKFDSRYCEYVIREHNYILEHLGRFAENPQGLSVQNVAGEYVDIVKGILDEAGKCAAKIKT